jgi:hypothetical protein
VHLDYESYELLNMLLEFIYTGKYTLHATNNVDEEMLAPSDAPKSVWQEPRPFGDFFVFKPEKVVGEGSWDNRRWRSGQVHVWRQWHRADRRDKFHEYTCPHGIWRGIVHCGFLDREEDFDPEDMATLAMLSNTARYSEVDSLREACTRDFEAAVHFYWKRPEFVLATDLLYRELGEDTEEMNNMKKVMVEMLAMQKEFWRGGPSKSSDAVKGVIKKSRNASF